LVPPSRRSSNGDLLRASASGSDYSLRLDYSSKDFGADWYPADAAVSNSERVEGSFIMKKMTVGRISVFMLVLFTCTDIILNMVNAQMQSLESPDYYDALSAEVIRPAFHYHSSNGDRAADRPRLGLGTAAISSVTQVLSPILPFTGGLDLRREDYWTNGWFGSVSSVFEQVRDAFSNDGGSDNVGSSFLNIPRGGGRVPSQPLSKKTSKKSTKNALSIGEYLPFIPVQEIADLTLQDVSMAFRYAIESTREDFNRNKFFSGVLPRVKNALGALSDVAAKSRGMNVKPAVTTGLATPDAETGDIDALHFCAAMRVLAEWRVLRQVPDGYKGYAVGMSLGQKDVVQNVAKIEQAVHTWINDRRELLSMQENFENESEEPICLLTELDGSCMTELRSPTLRDLLQFEIELDTHDNSKLPRLKDKTAAMGLLWVRRQLLYQTAVFTNVLEVPKTFKSTKDAVSAGYSEVYGKYHGWAVQKIFNYSFQAAPEAAEIYKFMNPHKLKEVVENARSGAACDSTNESNRMVLGRNMKGERHMNPFEKLGSHVGQEWVKFAGSVVHIFGGKPAHKEMAGVRGGSNDQIRGQHESDIEQYIMKEMAKDAHEQILSFLEVAQPLLKDLSGLFDELNMDDPTKV
jgi:hypothetical protein